MCPPSAGQADHSCRAGQAGYGGKEQAGGRKSVPEGRGSGRCGGGGGGVGVLSVCGRLRGTLSAVSGAAAGEPALLTGCAVASGRWGRAEQQSSFCPVGSGARNPRRYLYPDADRSGWVYFHFFPPGNFDPPAARCCPAPSRCLLGPCLPRALVPCLPPPGARRGRPCRCPGHGGGAAGRG